MGRALEPLDLLFYEDPVAPENLHRWSESATPSTFRSPRASASALLGHPRLVERELVDVIQPDTGRAGGITQMRKMAALAEAHSSPWRRIPARSGRSPSRRAPRHGDDPERSAGAGRVRLAGPLRGGEPVLRSSMAISPSPPRPGLGVDIDVEEIRQLSEPPQRPRPSPTTTAPPTPPAPRGKCRISRPASIGART